MTIEEVMSLIQTRGHGFRTEWATDEELRAALTALVAQARDEEAEACAGACYCDSCADNIRARIAGRKA